LPLTLTSSPSISLALAFILRFLLLILFTRSLFKITVELYTLLLTLLQRRTLQFFKLSIRYEHTHNSQELTLLPPITPSPRRGSQTNNNTDSPS